ncbi:MAG: SDR family oxidoreductase [Anaerolineae bacterium]|nr:SDR family oxidoreductase [Anaerolineae bacterium]
METHILVTGAPGNVGTEVVHELQRIGVPFRVGVHNVKTASERLGNNLEITHFDFLKPETYSATFKGIERMFLVRPPALSNVQRDIAPAIEAAVKAGVKQIVFLSIQGVENNRVVPHYKIEQLLLGSGVNYTFLRASFFMQNLSTTHRNEIHDHDEIALPVSHARTSFIDARDIAAVAAWVLTEAGHTNQKYTLTGAEALDYDQVASKLSATLHRTIRYTHPSIITFIRRQLALGQKLSYTLIMTALYTITRFGNAKTVTQDVERLLGRPPIGFDQFAEDYRNSWQPDAALDIAPEMQPSLRRATSTLDK